MKKNNVAKAAPIAVPKGPRYAVLIRVGGDYETIVVEAETGDEAAAKALLVKDHHGASVHGVERYSDSE